MWYPEDNKTIKYGKREVSEDYLMGQDGDLYTMLWDYDESPVGAEACNEPMLSTGCFDKNSKEIWDGDIVQWRTASGKNISYVVKWYEGNRNSIGAGWFLYIYHKRRVHGKDVECYDAFIHLNQACWGWPGEGAEKPVVIGNVMENPELMRGE
jgi:hypothetical protein